MVRSEPIDCVGSPGIIQREKLVVAKRPVVVVDDSTESICFGILIAGNPLGK